MKVGRKATLGLILGVLAGCAVGTPGGGGGQDDNNATPGNNVNNAPQNNSTNNANNSINNPNNNTNNSTNNATVNNSAANNSTPPTPICEAEAVRCADGATQERCSADGLSWAPEACGEGSICDSELGACAALICAPDEALGCQDTTLRVLCNGQGTARVVERCEGESRCIGGECLRGAGTCADDDECSDDHYCQAGICIPYGTGPRAENNPGCIQDPYEGAFAPAVQCRWEGGNVIMQPVVIDLDGDETPEIVFSWWDDNDYSQAFVTAIRGDTCEVVFQSPERAHAESSMAGGDINGDGVPEIVIVQTDGRLVALNNQLQRIWQSAATVDARSWGGPAIADLDQDGTAEIIHGAVVFNGEDGSVHFNQGAQRYGIGPLSAVADVDNDGQSEVVLGNRIYSATGQDETPPLMAGLAPGHVAIADFDPSTPEPEIAVVFGVNQVRVQRHTGEVIFGPYAVPGAYQSPGGAPNVGDFDGDGQVEIGTAGGNNYAVFDLECAATPLPAGCAQPGIRWFKPTRDASSGNTGSSLFDFEGDGSVEVVYNDECFMRVYDGTTGAIRFAFANTTNTTYENPIVVDVDGDFNSEIVLPANNIGAPCQPEAETGVAPGSTRGILVLRDVTDRWVNSRPIWNQHTYHVTNVEDDGRIPQVEAPSWQIFNSYRQNIQQEGKALDAPDLTASGGGVPVVRGGCGAVELRITIYNRGSQPVATGVPVSFFQGDPAQGGFICTARTTTRLEAGQGEEVGCTWAGAPDAAGQVTVLADTSYEGGQLVNRNTECFELNNLATLEVPSCQ